MGKALLERIKWTPVLESRIVELADSGLSNVEIAEIISTTRNAIEQRLRKIGYKRTNEQKSGIYKRFYVPNGCMPPNKPLEVREAEYAAKFNEREELVHLEYVSGYVGKDCNVTIRCKICGGEFTRWAKRLIRKKDPITFCPHCRKCAAKKKPRRRTILRRRACPTCGEVFMAQGREKYCSYSCYRIANREQIKRRSKELGLGSCINRAKYYGVAFEYGITLEKLIDRDNNVCHICGGACDKSDKRYGNVGDMYPTIDHVIPLAKGGTHTWDNVKLAHFICNSHKSDHIQAVVDDAAHGFCDVRRYAVGAVENACASDSRENRRRRRRSQYGAAFKAISRDNPRDCRVRGR